MADSVGKNERILSLLRDLHAVRLDEETVSTLSYLMGALRALQQAAALGFDVPPSGASRGRTMIEELRESIAEVGQGRPPGPAWEAGFHFNGALHRIAACADRMTKKLDGLTSTDGQARATRFNATPEVQEIYRSVNGLKHDFEGRPDPKLIDMDQALKAVEAILEMAKLHWPARQT